MAMRRGVSAEPERKPEGEVTEATYLRMDGGGKIREVLAEAGGEGDNGSDITVEEKEGRRGGERPEEIDASTER